MMAAAAIRLVVVGNSWFNTVMRCCAESGAHEKDVKAHVARCVGLRHPSSVLLLRRRENRERTGHRVLPRESPLSVLLHPHVALRAVRVRVPLCRAQDEREAPFPPVKAYRLMPRVQEEDVHLRYHCHARA